MPIFSIRFSFTNDKVIYRKSAIVRAPNPESAKEKLATSMVRLNGKPYESFSVENISVSSFNFMFI